METMTDYIREYRDAIRRGEITAGKWITMWYDRVVERMDSGEYRYSEERAKLAIRFIQRFCRHHEGELAPQLIKLELWQKALLCVIFGIVDADGNRQFREVLIVIGRKNGKTLFAAAIAAYVAYIDRDYGKRIFFCAPKLQQANLCYEGMFQMILKEPELSRMARKRRSDIYLEGNNTSAMPLAFSAKKSDGLNPSLCVCDEIAAWQGDAGLKQYEVLKSALGARKQPLILSITTAGYINDGVYDELIKRATSVLLGASDEHRLAPFLYMIDDIAAWDSPGEWKKSNPNLGVSVSEDYLREEMLIAKSSIPKKAEFLTKYCNVKQNSSQAWLEYEVVDATASEQMELEDFRGSYCVGGIDLSQTTDLTSCCAVIERDGKLYVFSQFFMPAARLETGSAEDGVPYEVMVRRGLLTISGEHYVDYDDVMRWYTALVEQYEIYPLQIGYDRYSAQALVQNMKSYGFHMDDVWQGFNLTPVIKSFEGLIKDGRISTGDNDLLRSHLLNTALKSDNEANRCQICKVGKRTRIDGTAALLDAMTMREKYTELAEQLKNA